MSKVYADGMKTVLIYDTDVISTSALVGDYVSLENYDSCTFLVWCTDGTAGQDLTVNIVQATTAGGNGRKNVDGVQWYSQEHGTQANVTGDAMTAAEVGAFVHDSESAAFARCEVFASDLDTTNDFKYISLRSVTAGANTNKRTTAIAVLQGARHAVAVPDQPLVTT